MERVHLGLAAGSPQTDETMRSTNSRVNIFSFVRYGDQLMLSPFVHALLAEDKLARLFTNQEGVEVFGVGHLSEKITLLPKIFRGPLALGLDFFGDVNCFNHKKSNFSRAENFFRRSRFLATKTVEPTAYEHRHALFADLLKAPCSQNWIYEVTPPEQLAATEQLAGLENFAVLVPGSHPSKPLRNWPPTILKKILRWLVEERGLPVVIMCGQDWAALASKVIAESGVDAARVLNLGGQLPFRASAAVLERSRMVVTPDTGLMHLAVALRRPVVTFTHPRYDIRLLLPPQVEAPVMAATLAAGIQFEDCAWERWRTVLENFEVFNRAGHNRVEYVSL
jgi:Glycosyltransferase family 9 (heptosyltransferase)